MLKKLAAFLMAAAMLLTMTAAGAESAQAPVTISFYSTQAGVDDETIALLDEFMAQHPGITVHYYPCLLYTSRCVSETGVYHQWLQRADGEGCRNRPAV